MIISLTEGELGKINEAIKKERKNSDNKKFRVTFSGGGSDLVKDSKSLEVREETIVFDGRSVDLKHVTGISVEEDGKSRKIVNFMLTQ
ncbi:hypothetical protein KAI56_01920 [Candidatus Parcubacteria bacterium]|nr:hypothetical protein [Candidatus Parcubacteria bacterium]